MKTDPSSQDDSNHIEVQRALIRNARLQAAKSRLPQHRDKELALLSSPTLGESEHPAFDANDSFCGYTILEEIHRGSQGIVHRAIDNGIKRIVALKVLREGPFASPHELARFEREIQVLGQLNHPNIVAIHDTGESAGHYFFAMDYIEGKPLDKFLFGSNSGHENSSTTAFSLPDIEGALGLFHTICEAVHAAHLRGVIHRDLKPNNILVDVNGEPHILDFGLAKFTGIESHGTAMTIAGQFIGSAPWSSPEQADGGSEFTDIRSDIYSLGVILFQMLTGSFPYEVHGNIRDVLIRIVHEEPMSPRSIRSEIDDEIETILLKCLSKKPERRYQSAGELASDVACYLADEPIAAKRDSTLYVLRKQFRKHRFAALIGIAFVLLTTVSAVGLSILYAQQRFARHQTEQQRQRAELNAIKAEHEAESAKVEQGRAKAVNQFLADMLSSVNPQISNGKEVSVRETLDKASALLNAGAIGEQVIEAAVRTTLGNSYLSIGRLAESEVELRRALSINQQTHTIEHLETASSLHNLGILMWTMGRFSDARSLFEDALAVRRRLLGNEHIDVSESMDYLAQVMRDEGRLLEAEALFRENVDLTRRLLGNDHVDLARTQSSLAKVLQAQGRNSEAEPLFVQSLAVYRKTHPEGSPDVAAGLKNLGSLIGEDEDRFPESEQLLRESLVIWRQLWEAKDSGIFMAMIYDALGALLQEEGKLEEAEPLLREAFESSIKVYGNSHPNVALCAYDLAILLTSKGDYDSADSLFHRSLDMRRRLFGNGHSLVADSLDGLAELNRLQGKLSEAESNSLEAVTIRRAATPIIPRHEADSIAILGAVLIAEAKVNEAEPLLRECLDIRLRTLAPENWKIAEAQGLLGVNLLTQGKNGEATSLLNSCYSKVQEITHVDSTRRRNAIERIIELLGLYGEAEYSSQLNSLFSK
jgi:serine/threonine protein kinase